MHRRVLALMVAALVLTGGCLGGSPAPDVPSGQVSTPASGLQPARPLAPPPPKPPAVGACYDLTFQQAAAPSTARAPVPCTGPHTSVTIHVGRVDPVTDGHLVAIDSRQVQQAIARTCPRQLASYLGGGVQARRLSRFQTVWFTPSLQAADKGADWYRCDLVLVAQRNRLGRLPGRARGILDRGGALDRYGTCANSSPASARFVRQVCAHPHSWRAVASIDLGKRARYLGRLAGDEADHTCRSIASARAGSELEFTWSFEWPTRKQWDAGQRWGYCWLPTG